MFAAPQMAVSYRRIGIIREGKVPPDKRVPITPDVARALLQRHPALDLTVQRSPVRAFTDAEYEAAGMILVDDLADRDLIIGIKEVPVDQLIPGKAHLFFSHTIKKQPHNRKLLQAALAKGITLMDHELLTNDAGERVLAFGHWAGVVGAYNALRGWHMLREAPPLKPAHACHDLGELTVELKRLVHREELRIVMTGSGRVGKGALEMLQRAGIQRISPREFMDRPGQGGVLTVLGSSDLYHRTDGLPFDRDAFHRDPSGHVAEMLPFARTANVYIATHFWDPRAPKILPIEVLRDADLAIRLVADVSCDVDGPIDSTVRASTIEVPFYGFHPGTGRECAWDEPGAIVVMAVDNLPCELPRDASEAFAHDLLENVMPAITGQGNAAMLERATIVRDGRLTERFAYLADYAGLPVDHT